MADLARAIGTDEVRIDFSGCRAMATKPHPSGCSNYFELDKPIDGKNVLVVEDIVDTVDDELHHETCRLATTS